MGLIGENGAGKSTTIKCILNLVRRDGGEIQVLGLDNLADERAVKAQVGVVLDETTFHDGSPPPKWGAFSPASTPAGMEPMYQHYLEKFGLTSKKLVKTFSKGMKMKLSLAAAFAARPRLLILDEPTNHLDSAMADWLEEYLKRFKGALLMITHDRYFLDSVTNRIVELDNGKLYSYQANYEGFLELKAGRMDMEQASERKRQSILRVELEWMKRGARARSTKQKGGSRGMRRSGMPKGRKRSRLWKWNPFPAAWEGRPWSCRGSARPTGTRCS